MRQQLRLILLGYYFVACSFAGSMGTEDTAMDQHPWRLIGSAGYTFFQDVSSGGSTAVGRFAIGRELFRRGEYDLDQAMVNIPKLSFGAELGVQTGNQMKLSVSQSTTRAMGGQPIWSTIKPMFDVLGTLTYTPFPDEALFAVLKGGVAWRQWEMSRETVNNLTQAAAEVQAGIGLPILERVFVSVLYQGIYGGNPNFKATITKTSRTATVSNIPLQNGVLLSLSFAL